MSKWNKPEINEVKINETATVDKTLNWELAPTDDIWALGTYRAWDGIKFIYTNSLS